MGMAETASRRASFAALIERGTSAREASRQVGVSATVGYRWLAMYRRGGLEWLLPVGDGRVRYPFLLKYQVVQALRAGVGEAVLLKTFGLRSGKTAHRWRRAFEESGAAGLGGTDADLDMAESAPPPKMETVQGRSRPSDQARRVFADAVASGCGYESASKRAGVTFSTGWRWYHKLKAGQPITLGSMNVPRRYSPELKLRAAKAIVDDGEPRSHVARRFEIRSHSTMDQWADQYRKHGELAFTPLARTERSSAEKPSTVAQERSALTDVLGHLDANLPTEMKVQIVQSLAGQYPVRVLLRALRLPPSTYYYRRSRPPKADRYATVRPMLRLEFETAYSAYGYRRMRARLRRKHGVQISGKTVRRLMREEGCRCQVRRRKRRMPPEAVNPANVFAPNLLQRNFAADEPGQKWVTDVTQFAIEGTVLYLSPLLDLCTRKVVSYRLDTNQNMPMVLGMLTDALPHARAGTTMLHSDRGWQYQHGNFRHHLRQHGITQSMSRSGNCYDNAVAENFFSHFKQEFLRGRTFTLDTFPIELARWIEWFNTERITLRR